MEDDYRQRNREAAIARREERWQSKLHNYITDLLDAYQDQLDTELNIRTTAKSGVVKKAKDEAKLRSEKNAKQ